ncbi:LppU/SCO3897 family protein [Streptomyces cinnamoneus]|uniref:LppU/SCO3897 family protein n=1 Tax=Streptomyces cinnamoneus TaxID=53446 RepID=UPI0037880E65
MPNEITLYLTPEEAASGVTKVVYLPTGSLSVRVPPVQDGGLVRISTDQGPMLLRIRVMGESAPPPAPPPPPAKQPAGKNPLAAAVFTLVALGVLAVVVVLNNSDDSKPSASAPTTGAPSPLFSDSRPRATTAPDGGRTIAPPPVPTPASPFSTGTCLGGTLPDSTTPVTVHNVKRVDCSSSDAHYRVIETFFATTDLGKCRGNPDTQYAYSSETTLGGRTINSIVYCLVGMRSYAR